MTEKLINEFNRYPNLWITLIIILALLTYATYKIKNEPNDYLKKSKSFEFNNFLFQLPSWWTMMINEKNLIRFERTDTRYDWYAEYRLGSESLLPIKDILFNLVNELDLVFDEKNNLEEFKLEAINVVRMEGMSTINGIERAYFDIFVAESEGKILIGKSHSSILNGCVEGPYFEEVLQRLKYKA